MQSGSHLLSAKKSIFKNRGECYYPSLEIFTGLFVNERVAGTERIPAGHPERGIESLMETETEQSLFRGFFYDSPEACVLADPISRRILDINAAAARILHYALPLLEKTAIDDIFSGEGEKDDPLGFAKFGQAYEALALRSDGKEIPVEIKTQIMRIRESDVLRVIIRDITEMKKMESIRRFQRRIIEAALVAENMKDLIATIREYLGEFMDVRNFYIALFDEESEMYQFPFFTDDSDNIEHSYPLEDLRGGCTEYVRRTGKSVIIDREEEKRLQDSGDLKIEPIGTDAPIWMGVPIRNAKNMIMAVMAVQDYSDGYAYDKRDLEVMEAAADSISLALEKQMVVDELKASEERYRTTLDNMKEGYYQVDIDGNLTYFNRALQELLGYSNEELRGMNYRNLIDLSQARIVYAKFHEAFHSREKSQALDWVLRRKDGTECVVKTSISVIEQTVRDPSTGEESVRVAGFKGMIEDVTELRAAENALQESETRFRSVLENSRDVLYRIDLSTGLYDYMSPSVISLLGMSPDADQEEIWQVLLDGIHENDRERRENHWESLFGSDRVSGTVEFRVRTQNGDWRWLSDNHTIVRNEMGDEIYVIGNVRDITERVRNEEDLNRLNAELARKNEELTSLSMTDELTGLNNRRMMTIMLEAEVRRSDRSQKPFSVLMLDIDHFKRVNDTHGHDAGDLVLQIITKILGKCLRTTDTIARWGGEEFIVLLPETDIESAYVVVADKILNAIRHAQVEYEGIPIPLTISIGVASFEKGMTIDEVVRRSDRALYKAKEKRNDAVPYDVKLEKNGQRQMAAEGSILPQTTTAISSEAR